MYVGGLAQHANSSHVLDAFIPFGEIVEVQVPKDDSPNAQGPHRGFAYVEYEDPADAKEAIDNMDQAEFFGKILKCSQAKAPKSADEGLGSKTAIWEQVRSTNTTVATLSSRVLRKDGWQRMQLMENPDQKIKRHPWMAQHLIQCRVLKDLMWLVRSLNRRFVSIS